MPGGSMGWTVSDCHAVLGSHTAIGEHKLSLILTLNV